MHPISRSAWLLAVASLGLAGPARAQGQENRLADFSLEQLSDIVVTSVSRQETRLANAATSIYRISGLEIRRSGATTLADALRLAPNLQVARVDAHTWAVTARGFASSLENKMLVLIDGRSVYSPLFSGVFWDMQDVLLEDVDRIEVISGPGSTIWGANAVNGVINIITKAARDTQGGYAALTRGGGEARAEARYGVALGAAGHARLYATYGHQDGLPNQTAVAPYGAWERRQAGMRADFKAGDTDWTVSADVFDGWLGAQRVADTRISGGNLMARVVRHLAAGSDLRVQAYLDQANRAQAGSAADRMQTFDLEVQHDHRVALSHMLSWGAGYRYARDRVANGGGLQFLPAEAPLRWVNLFVQDEIMLRPDLRLTVGTKAEQTTYTGWEWLPNLRLAWNLTPNRALWAAATRAVRAPSRIDRDLYLPTPGGRPDRPRYLVAGGPDFTSEIARVLELGFRDQPAEGWSWSATLFGASYDQLRTLEPLPGGSSVFKNLGEGSTRGIEAWGSWQAAPSWRLELGAVAQHVGASLKPSSHDASAAGGLATNDPPHYWSLRSLWDIDDRLRLDLFYRRVASLPRPVVPAYDALDARLAWEPRPGLEVSVTGRNLLQPRHAEFGSSSSRPLVERAVLLNVNVRF